MYALSAGEHTAALQRRVTVLLKHKCWDVDDDGKWVRSLLTHVVTVLRGMSLRLRAAQ